MKTAYLTFQIGETEYGVPMDQVEAVSLAGNLIPVPYMQDDFVGLLNLRGEIISIYRAKGDHRSNRGQSVIVFGDTQRGILVDDLTGVKTEIESQGIKFYEMNSQNQVELSENEL